jgi:hypothetical protein
VTYSHETKKYERPDSAKDDIQGTKGTSIFSQTFLEFASTGPKPEPAIGKEVLSRRTNGICIA